MNFLISVFLTKFVNYRLASLVQLSKIIWLLKLKLQYRKLHQHFNHYITYDNIESERSNLLQKVIPNSTKISKSTRIKSLIFYPFSKVLCALSISKRLQFNAGPCNLNANLSAVCFDSKSSSHGSAKHFV